MSSFNTAAESLEATPPPKRHRSARPTTNGQAESTVSVTATTNSSDSSPVHGCGGSAAKETAKDNNKNSISPLRGHFPSHQTEAASVLTPSPENHIADHGMPDLSEPHPRNPATTTNHTSSADEAENTSSSNNNKNCSNPGDVDTVRKKYLHGNGVILKALLHEITYFNCVGSEKKVWFNNVEQLKLSGKSSIKIDVNV